MVIARQATWAGNGLLVLALLAGACGSGSGKGGRGGGGGGGGGTTSLGSGGMAGGGGTGGTSAPVTCTTSTTGCRCHEGPPATQEPACTSTSVVKGAGDVGICCGGFLCECTAYICRHDAGLDFCSCAASYTVTGIINGSVVTHCPLPTGQIKCCYQPDLNDCTCAVGACLNGRLQVASCSIDDVTICRDGNLRVDRCSNVGGGSGGAGASGSGGAGPSGGGGATGGASGLGGASGSSAGASGSGGAAVDGGRDQAGAGTDGPPADHPSDAPPCGFDGGCTKAKGAACGADGECLSGHCVEGLCCDSACAGECVSCGVLGSEGTCLPILHGTDFRSCAATSTCSPAGTCKKAEGESCSAASECALGACPASHCCGDSACQRAYGWSHLTGAYNTTLATGPSAQIVLGGVLGNCVDLDPGPGAQIRCPPLPGQSAVITLLDRDGRYLWARTWDSATSIDVRRVEFAPSGLVVIGSFSGSVDFDPSDHAAVQTAAPGVQAWYLSRFDLSGNWISTQTWTAQGLAFWDMAVGADGVVAIVGNWFGTLDLDPGAAVVSETNAGSTEAFFVLKLASDGTYAWHHVIPTYTVDGVDVAPDGSVGIGGRFRQATDFDPGPAVFTITPPIDRIPCDYLTVFDRAGTFAWVHSFETRSDLANDAVHVAALEGGGWAVAASFQGLTADFDPLGAHESAITHWNPNASDRDIFLTYLTATGGYVKTFATGSTLNEYLSALRRRKGGGVWLFALLYGSTDIDPGSGVVTKMGPALLEIGSQMEYVGSVTPGGYYDPFSPSPVDNSVLVLTNMTTTTDFDPGPGTDTIVPPQTGSSVVLTKFWP